MAQSPPTSNFPPIRACIFDLDGLLLNTEDIYTHVTNTLLSRFSRPPLPWSLKAQLMGVPGSSNGDVFHAWAQLPISRAEYRDLQAAEQAVHFAGCVPLPGVEDLLAGLTTTGVEVALASSCSGESYERKVVGSETRRVMGMIPEGRRVLGDDGRVKGGRGKPRGDIYLVALEAINASLGEGVPRIEPRECLVFEDSVPGVEAGRRAGMRVVWVPHLGLLAEYEGREGEVLAGRMGLVEVGDEHELGEVGDGWAERLDSLVGFAYEKYGIQRP